MQQVQRSTLHPQLQNQRRRTQAPRAQRSLLQGNMHQMSDYERVQQQLQRQQHRALEQARQDVVEMTKTMRVKDAEVKQLKAQAVGMQNAAVMCKSRLSAIETHSTELSMRMDLIEDARTMLKNDLRGDVANADRSNARLQAQITTLLMARNDDANSFRRVASDLREALELLRDRDNKRLVRLHEKHTRELEVRQQNRVSERLQAAKAAQTKQLATIGMHEEEIHDLEQELEDTQAATMSADNDHQEFVRQTEELAHDSDQIKEKMRSLSKSHAKATAMAASLEALNLAINDAESTRNHHAENVQQIKIRVKHEVHREMRLKREKETLACNLNTARKNCDTATTDLDKRNEELDEVCTKLNALQAEIDELEEKEQALQNSSQATRTAALAEHVSKLTQEVETARASFASLTESTSLPTRQKELEAKRGMLAATRKQVTGVAESIQEVKQELSYARANQDSLFNRPEYMPSAVRDAAEFAVEVLQTVNLSSPDDDAHADDAAKQQNPLAIELADSVRTSLVNMRGEYDKLLVEKQRAAKIMETKEKNRQFEAMHQEKCAANERKIAEKQQELARLTQEVTALRASNERRVAAKRSADEKKRKQQMEKLAKEKKLKKKKSNKTTRATASAATAATTPSPVSRKPAARITTTRNSEATTTPSARKSVLTLPPRQPAEATPRQQQQQDMSAFDWPAYDSDDGTESAVLLSPVVVQRTNPQTKHNLLSSSPASPTSMLETAPTSTPRKRKATKKKAATRKVLSGVRLHHHKTNSIAAVDPVKKKRKKKSKVSSTTTTASIFSDPDEPLPQQQERATSFLRSRRRKSSVSRQKKTKESPFDFSVSPPPPHKSTKRARSKSLKPAPRNMQRVAKKVKTVETTFYSNNENRLHRTNNNRDEEDGWFDEFNF